MPHGEINHPLIWISFFWISGCSGMASVHGYTEQAQKYLFFFYQNLSLFSCCCSMHFNGKVLRSWSKIGPGDFYSHLCFTALPFPSLLFFHHMRWTALHQCSGRWPAVLHLVVCNKHTLNDVKYFYLGSKLWYIFSSFLFCPNEQETRTENQLQESCITLQNIAIKLICPWQSWYNL